MATPSPSEFLTFYRRLTTHPSLRRGLAASATQTSRPLSTSIPRYGYGKAGNKTFSDEQHTTQKTDRSDVQNENSQAGREAHATGTGGTASSRRDERSSTARAKKEHPEAPDVVIGMQDERGGKGV
ncbi:uncharacterized protein BKCO1_240006 [Diplodia corticola]|uniref:Uncharacterized protein n=1 Tax=Diplodia corticola TaxID=236234 RepID=A0A1J9S2L3_9PEZI|nr:uncharacterized protein BKCO1_240006 [Diplodia corticola]OJD34244.1 hypothetical protein BKCO1_240006 [Diplodia corticola]